MKCQSLLPSADALAPLAWFSTKWLFSLNFLICLTQKISKQFRLIDLLQSVRIGAWNSNNNENFHSQDTEALFVILITQHAPFSRKGLFLRNRIRSHIDTYLPRHFPEEIVMEQNIRRRGSRKGIGSERTADAICAHVKLLFILNRCSPLSCVISNFFVVDSLLQ